MPNSLFSFVFKINLKKIATEEQIWEFPGNETIHSVGHKCNFQNSCHFYPNLLCSFTCAHMLTPVSLYNTN